MSDEPARWVLHVDLDQFIAAVEVLRHPELAGKPVIVGGRGDPTERAVVSTASYEAREYGVGSGMPLRIAARKIPDAVILPVDAPAYTAASEEVMATLRAQPGAVVQVLGWDEAFIGIATDDPESVARRLQQAVLDRTSLHCSVGIGDTLVRAKVATGFGKPQGVFRLTAENWPAVMGARPTIELWGVGTKVSRRLAGARHPHRRGLGIRRRGSCSRVSSARRWVRGTASSGAATAPRWSTTRRGCRAGTAARRPTSRISPSAPRSRRPCDELLAQVLDDVVAEGRPVIGLTLKVRYAPFLTKIFTKKIPDTFDRDLVRARAMDLLAKVEPDRPIRLLGVRLEMAMPDDAREGHSPTRSGW